MSGISSLQSIHKKGLFGNHYKKKESDLLQISEIKNVIIVQIVQYKKSQLKLKEIQIDGLQFPEKNSTVISNDKTRILWNAPRTWLVVSKNEDIVKIIKKTCNDESFAVTDISHSRAIVQIKGTESREVLKKGSPLNYNEFRNNNCASTVFNGITILVDLLSENPDEFNIFVLRSFGESFYQSITDASLEMGYNGI